MRDLNFEQDVKVQPDALDVEWADYPDLHFHYGKAVVVAQGKLDDAKEHLDVVKAEVDAEIRNAPADKKPTENAITAQVSTHPKVRKAYSELIDAKEELGMVQAAMNSIERKKSALENLVKLALGGYNAMPKVPRDLVEEWRKRSEKDLTDGMRRRRDEKIQQQSRRTR